MALLHSLPSATSSSPVPASPANPIPVSNTVGGAAVSSTNPQPVTGATADLSTSMDWAVAGDVQNGALTDTIKAAAGGSGINTCSYVTLSAGTLGAAATVSIKDGAGGTVKWQARLQTTGCAPTTHYFKPPIQSTANTLLEIATTDPTSGLIYWSAGGSVVS